MRVRKPIIRWRFSWYDENSVVAGKTLKDRLKRALSELSGGAFDA